MKAYGRAFAVCLALSLAAPVTAQDADEEDVIVVQGRRSPAMTAFEAGDYATAEVEFARNARCALRVERNGAAAIDQIQSGQVDQNVRGTPSSTSAGAGQNGAPPATAAPTPQGFRVPPGRQGKDNTRPDCAERGFQVYMKGLSQLKLGKIEAARDSFRQAGNLDRNLYDAQYRLGLIALLDGDEKEVRWRVRALSSILRRCKRHCDAREEIAARREHLERALRGEVPTGG